MAFHLQNSRAIFKIYLPVEQNLECFLLRAIVNHYSFIEITSKRAHNRWGLLNRTQRTLKKKSLAAINAKYSGKSQRACFVSPILLKTSNSREKGRNECIASCLSGCHFQVGVRVMVLVGQPRTHCRGFWDALKSVNTNDTSVPEALDRLAWSVP